MDKLYIPCPAEGCTNKQNRYWYHDGCGGMTQFRYSDIFIVCSHCQRSAIMFDWLFKCEAHGFKPGTRQGWLCALSVLGQTNGN
jgi:hypothetical protein